MGYSPQGRKESNTAASVWKHIAGGWGREDSSEDVTS